MKYIYKKQLPLIKLKLNEQIKVEVDEESPPVEIWADPLIKCSPAGLETLIEQGFLEEVKPREGWIRFDLIHDKAEIKENYWDESKFIKVREVLE
jgi:hypothetical protein